MQRMAIKRATIKQTDRPADRSQAGHAALEVNKFNALAARWWDPKGPMAPLHWMNPARLAFIHEQLAAAGILPSAHGLDLGCGAGLLTEPLARSGFAMTGYDGAADAIAVARKRAQVEGLPLTYQVGLSDDVSGSYNFTCALEIIEHIDDPADFIRQLAVATKPGGLIFLSTLNRTLASRAFAVWGSEYLLRSLPIGTHDWHSFVKPSELVALLEAAGCELVALEGLVCNPFARSFSRDPHRLQINYIMCARRKADPR